MMNDAQTGNITGHNTIASALTNIVTGKEDANFSSPNGKYNFFTCSSNTLKCDEYAFNASSILIAGNGEFNVKHYTGKFNAYQRTYILDRFEENMTYVKFFLQMFLPKRIKGEKNDGNTPYIVLSTLSEMEFSIPCIIEQTKIADFLSSVDEKISLLNKQYDLLCQYKKGMMQKIFSQEVRFKDENGEGYPEWKYVDLKEIASKVNIKNREGLVNVVLTNSATQGIVRQDSYFEREIVTESNLQGYYVVSVGDFIYNPRISATAPVGPIKMNELIQGVMSPLYTVFRFKKGLLKFYQYFFESSVFAVSIVAFFSAGLRLLPINSCRVVPIITGMSLELSYACGVVGCEVNTFPSTVGHQPKSNDIVPSVVTSALTFATAFSPAANNFSYGISLSCSICEAFSPSSSITVIPIRLEYFCSIICEREPLSIMALLNRPLAR